MNRETIVEIGDPCGIDTEREPTACTAGDLITVKETVNALANEIGTFSDEEGAAQIPDLQDPTTVHTISGRFYRNPLSDEVESVSVQGLAIDDQPAHSVESLRMLGLDDAQMALLHNNSVNATRLLRAQELGQQHPNDTVRRLLGHCPDIDIARNGNMAVLLSVLNANDAFVLLEAAGNVDGSKRNPLRFTMAGRNSLRYHPTESALTEGVVDVPFVSTEQQAESLGSLDRLKHHAADLARNGLYPIHPYNLENGVTGGDIFVRERVPMRVLMSKRSMMPVGSDEQVKLSAGFQITTRNRIIHWSEAKNAIANTNVIEALADAGKLPPDTWVVPDRYAMRIGGDDATTSVMRGGMNDLISNSGKLPDNAIPVAATCLWGRNVLKSSNLFQELVMAGVDPDAFIEAAIRRVMHTQLDMMDAGILPESHSQNFMYLLDRQTFMPIGAVLRDNEGSKIAVNKLRDMGIRYDGVYDEKGHATSPLSDDNPDLFRTIATRYLHYGVFDSNIVPLIGNAVPLYARRSADDYKRLVKDTYIDWWTSRGKTFDDFTRVTAPGYHQHNLAVRGLKIKGHPGARVSPTHPLIPSYDEMRAVL